MKAKYTFNFGDSKLVMYKGMSESPEHIVLKLLSYILFQKRPKIEHYANQHHKPDLVIQDDYTVTLWVECGEVSIKKLDKVSTHNNKADIFVVKETVRQATDYKEKADKKIRHPERVTYIGFKDGFVNKTAATFERTNDIKYSLENGEFFLNINGSSFSSKIWTSRATAF